MGNISWVQFPFLTTRWSFLIQGLLSLEHWTLGAFTEHWEMYFGPKEMPMSLQAKETTEPSVPGGKRGHIKSKGWESSGGSWERTTGVWEEVNILCEKIGHLRLGAAVLVGPVNSRVSGICLHLVGSSHSQSVNAYWERVPHWGLSFVLPGDSRHAPRLTDCCCHHIDPIQVPLVPCRIHQQIETGVHLWDNTISKEAPSQWGEACFTDTAWHTQS